MRGTRSSVHRFDVTARVLHWSFAAAFLACLISGLLVGVPSLNEVVPRRALLRSVHLWSGAATVLTPVGVGLFGRRATLCELAHEIAWIHPDDWRIRRRGDHSDGPGFFNAGQKLFAVTTAAGSVLFAATGAVMWQWARFPWPWRQSSIALHEALTYFFIVLIAGHLYLTLLHRPTRHSLRGMVSGQVDAAWAARHHPRWVTNGPTGDEETTPGAQTPTSRAASRRQAPARRRALSSESSTRRRRLRRREST